MSLTLAPLWQQSPRPARWLVCATQAWPPLAVYLQKVFQKGHVIGYFLWLLQLRIWPKVETSQLKKKSPTYGFIAGHGHETLLLDVGFGGRVAATGMKPSVVDAQHHPVAETLATGHCALEERQHITMSLSMLYHFSFRFQQIAPNQSDKWIAWAAMSIQQWKKKKNTLNWTVQWKRSGIIFKKKTNRQ